MHNFHHIWTRFRAWRADPAHYELELILKQLETIMATLADIQAKQVATDAAVAKVKTDVETLVAKIAAIPPGGLTPEQQAAIDDIATHADAINTALGGIDTEANAPAVNPSPTNPG